MAFRADEAAADGLRRVTEYFVRRSLYETEREYQQTLVDFEDLTDELGPAIDCYPTWHPLVAKQARQYTEFAPSDRTGYRGLDHTRMFAHGFITCPYDDGQRVLDSVAELPAHPVASITARRLDMKLYNEMTTPIVVQCQWRQSLELESTVPQSLIVPLLLEKELPNWQTAEIAETWESMRSSFLGEPSGRVSSLLVSRESGQAIKRIWNSLIYTGMFGNINVA